MKPSVGIIGTGRLGRALARVFADHGIPEDHLFLSHAGDPKTRAAITECGWLSCLCSNEEVCSRSDIIFLAVQPRSAGALAGLPFRQGKPVVSCMAGVPSGLLSSRLNTPVYRMMPSGPETLLAKKGIVAVYPDNPFLERFLSQMDLKIYTLPDEQAMHSFTAAVSLPAAILAAGSMDIQRDRVRLFRAYPLIAEIYPWAMSILPQFCSPEEQEAYIAGMSTQGGVTEAMVSSIRAGEPLFASIRKGIVRGEEISREMEDRI